MKNAVIRKPYQLNLSEQDLLLLLGATAETLEERRHPHGRADLVRLVGLHARLRQVWGETAPEYVINDGAVSLAHAPDTVIVPLPGSRSACGASIGSGGRRKPDSGGDQAAVHAKAVSR